MLEADVSNRPPSSRSYVIGKLWRLRWLTRGWRRSNWMMFPPASWIGRAVNSKRNNYLLLRSSRVHWGVFHMQDKKSQKVLLKFIRRATDHPPDRAPDTVAPAAMPAPVHSLRESV